MFEEAYLENVRNRITNFINGTVTDVITHLQYSYVQLMQHEILEREDIIKKTIYNPRDPIAIVISTVEELFEFADITGTSYTQLQAVNIACYVR